MAKLYGEKFGANEKNIGQFTFYYGWKPMEHFNEYREIFKEATGMDDKAIDSLKKFQIITSVSNAAHQYFKHGADYTETIVDGPATDALIRKE